MCLSHRDSKWKDQGLAQAQLPIQGHSRGHQGGEVLVDVSSPKYVAHHWKSLQVPDSSELHSHPSLPGAQDEREEVLFVSLHLSFPPFPVQPFSLPIPLPHSPSPSPCPSPMNPAESGIQCPGHLMLGGGRAGLFFCKAVNFFPGHNRT